ncbi:hypothetical protein J7S33_04760, partial [Saccharothrix algeriensis]
YRRAFRYPVGAYVLSVQFTEPQLPVRCFGLSQLGAEGVLTQEEDLDLPPGRMVHLTARDVQPGVLGIGWEWT